MSSKQGAICLPRSKNKKDFFGFFKTFSSVFFKIVLQIFLFLSLVIYLPCSKNKRDFFGFSAPVVSILFWMDLTINLSSYVGVYWQLPAWKQYRTGYIWLDLKFTKKFHFFFIFNFHLLDGNLLLRSVKHRVQ